MVASCATGAIGRKIGKFELAHKGTLFLDEISELYPELQVKLLRVLEERRVMRVGGSELIDVDFRLIAATNKDLEKEIADGRFREDLYYRLNVFPIHVPPLRERLEDVPELALHFLARFAAEEGRRVNAISADALRLLTSYSWPGNVRQLENAVFRAVVLADRPELQVSEFPQIAVHVEGFKAMIPEAPAPVDNRPVIKGPVVLGAEQIVPQTMEMGAVGSRSALGIPAVTDSGEIRSLEAMEADMIRLALGRYRGHMTEVAKRLGIGRSTLYRKMRDFGLEERIG